MKETIVLTEEHKVGSNCICDNCLPFDVEPTVVTNYSSEWEELMVQIVDMRG